MHQGSFEVPASGKTKQDKSEGDSEQNQNWSGLFLNFKLSFTIVPQWILKGKSIHSTCTGKIGAYTSQCIWYKTHAAN